MMESSEVPLAADGSFAAFHGCVRLVPSEWSQHQDLSGS